jgi:hypothetical protein
MAGRYFFVGRNFFLGNATVCTVWNRYGSVQSVRSYGHGCT